jgi:hypothetical protein
MRTLSIILLLIALTTTLLGQQASIHLASFSTPITVQPPSSGRQAIYRFPEDGGRYLEIAFRNLSTSLSLVVEESLDNPFLKTCSGQQPSKSSPLLVPGISLDYFSTFIASQGAQTPTFTGRMSYKYLAIDLDPATCGQSGSANNAVVWFLWNGQQWIQQASSAQQTDIATIQFNETSVNVNGEGNVFSVAITSSATPPVPSPSPSPSPSPVPSPAPSPVPSPAPSPVPSPPPPGQVTAVSISDLAFKPNSITIKVGGTVQWTNNDQVSHTVTHDASGANQLFNSGVLRSGGTFEHKFNQAGTFPYHCMIHPFMHGTVIVQM